MAEAFCEDCDHAHAETRNRPSRFWLCTKFPRRQNVSHVVRGEWAKDEPYARCDMLNGLFVCPLFEPTRDDNG